MAVANTYSLRPDWALPNFLYYWGVLYRAKWLILSVTFIFALVGVGTAVTTPNVYQATTVVTLVRRDSGGEVRRLARSTGLLGLGGVLTDALGVNASNNSRHELLAIFKSRDFLTRFAKSRRRVQALRKPSDFDPDASDRDEIRDIPPLQQAFTTLKRAHGQFRGRLSIKVEELMRKLYKPPGFDRDPRQRNIPGSTNGHKRFRRIIAIERKPRQGLFYVNVRWKDPVVAAEWANALIVEFNSFLRETAVAQSRKRIAYLNRELDETHVIPLRQAIYRLIEVETRAIMIAETRTDYAFKVIDPAMPPNFDDPIRPKRGLLIRTTTLTGFIIAVFAAILRDFVRMLREQDGGSPAAR